MTDKDKSPAPDALIARLRARPYKFMHMVADPALMDEAADALAALARDAEGWQAISDRYANRIAAQAQRIAELERERKDALTRAKIAEADAAERFKIATKAEAALAERDKLLLDVAASLAAAVNLLEYSCDCKDRLLDQRLKDYAASVERVRAYFAAIATAKSAKDT